MHSWSVHDQVPCSSTVTDPVAWCTSVPVVVGVGFAALANAGVGAASATVATATTHAPSRNGTRPQARRLVHLVTERARRPTSRGPIRPIPSPRRPAALSPATGHPASSRAEHTPRAAECREGACRARGAGVDDQCDRGVDRATTSKIPISLPDDVLATARQAVVTGRASSRVGYIASVWLHDLPCARAVSTASRRRASSRAAPAAVATARRSCRSSAWVTSRSSSRVYGLAPLRLRLVRVASATSDRQLAGPCTTWTSLHIAQSLY